MIEEDAVDNTEGTAIEQEVPDAVSEETPAEKQAE